MFIFKINGQLSTNTFSNVILINSASLCNVYWQINGAFSLGDSSVFRGTLLINGAISLLEGSSLFGRGLSRAGAIDLHNNIVTIGMNPTASIISANGPTTFCVGSSVLLSGNSGGTWSNGATTPSINVIASGDYFVTNTTTCGSSISNHIIVKVNALPNCLINGNGTICNGQSPQLCAPSGFYKYLWSTGGKTNCITINTTGTYSITVTSSNGCSSVCSKTVASSTLCPGKISGVVWFDINMNGIYDLQEKGINGLRVYIIDAMTGALVATITTSVKPGSPSDDGYYSISNLKPGMYYVKFQSIGPFVASQPYKGSNPNKDSDITHENGLNSTKKFTVINGEVFGNIDAGFQIKPLIGGLVWSAQNYNELQDIEEIQIAEVQNALNASIYPNPVNDQLKVDLWIPQDSDLEIKVYDQTGKAVLIQPFGDFKTKGSYSELIETNSLAAGQYVLQIMTTSGVISKKFVVFR